MRNKAGVTNGSGSIRASTSRRPKSACAGSTTASTVPVACFRRKGTRTRHPARTDIAAGTA